MLLLLNLTKFCENFGEIWTKPSGHTVTHGDEDEEEEEEETTMVKLHQQISQLIGICLSRKIQRKVSF